MGSLPSDMNTKDRAVSAEGSPAPELQVKQVWEVDGKNFDSEADARTHIAHQLRRRRALKLLDEIVEPIHRKASNRLHRSLTSGINTSLLVDAIEAAPTRFLEVVAILQEGQADG